MDTQKKALYLLSEKFPNRAAVIEEISELVTSLNLPKSPEHFMSDLHGESEAFMHIMKNGSGAVRNVIDEVLPRLSKEERAELACIVYYPREKLEMIRKSRSLDEEEYTHLIYRLLLLCKSVYSKYTRKKTEKMLGYATLGYAETIEELMGCLGRERHSEIVFRNAVKSIIRLGGAEEFIHSVCSALRYAAVDKLHIIGDIFDRGAGAHEILDILIEREGVDIEWGNHDALWLGAACGSRVCIATVVKNCILYSVTETLESAYGISLMPLAVMAQRIYRDARCDVYAPREERGAYSKEKELISKMHKAISVMLFKLEGETVRRNPLFRMDDRRLLEKIDFDSGKIKISGKEYTLRDCDLPTVDRSQPYTLSEDEESLMRYLESAFSSSEKLKAHAQFLLKVGGMYRICNRNLLFHGCIPMDDTGDFLPLPCAEGRCGRALMDFFDASVRAAFRAPLGTRERLHGMDLLWFLWCGRGSPLSARDAIRTFERLLICEPDAAVEEKNAYYRVWEDEALALKILSEFSLSSTSHIINGHIPVRVGENPIKGGGRVIVIDGGFCSAYRKITGICGYTLIYDSLGMHLCAHEAFAGKNAAIQRNADILSKVNVFESSVGEIRVRESDEGFEIRERIADLIMLLEAYKNGDISEKRA